MPISNNLKGDKSANIANLRILNPLLTPGINCIKPLSIPKISPPTCPSISPTVVMVDQRERKALARGSVTSVMLPTNCPMKAPRGPSKAKPIAAPSTGPAPAPRPSNISPVSKNFIAPSTTAKRAPRPNETLPALVASPFNAPSTEVTCFSLAPASAA